MAQLDDISVADIIGHGPGGRDGSASSRALVLTCLRQNPDGASVQQVGQLTGLSASRVRQILENLVRDREAYDRDFPGIRGKLYYPNGKLIHRYLLETQELGAQIFRFSFHESKSGPRLQIQERSFSLVGGERLEGSIYIDFANIEPLLQAFEGMMARYQQFEKGDVPRK